MSIHHQISQLGSSYAIVESDERPKAVAFVNLGACDPHDTLDTASLNFVATPDQLRDYANDLTEFANDCEAFARRHGVDSC